MIKLTNLNDYPIDPRFFEKIFNKIYSEYRQLLRFSTPGGDFGIDFVRMKYKNQTYIEVVQDKQMKYVKRHDEVILQEIIFTIDKAL